MQWHQMTDPDRDSEKEVDNLSIEDPMFKVGDLVALRADPSRTGPIIEELPLVAAHRRYRVFHSPTDIREYLDQQLQPVAAPAARGGTASALEAGAWVDVDTFRARLT